MNENTHHGVKELLLSALANETDQSVRHKVSDTIAEIARFDLTKGGKQKSERRSTYGHE